MKDYFAWGVVALLAVSCILIGIQGAAGKILAILFVPDIILVNGD